MSFAAVTLLSLLIVAIGCQAVEPSSPPVTQPSTLQATVAVAPHNNEWTATITWTNSTDHGLAIGRYASFVLSCMDTTPATTVSSSPAGSMMPHFRVLVPAHSTQVSIVTLYAAPAPLPPGNYQATIIFPKDVYPTPLQVDFAVPSNPETAPASP